MAYIKIRLILLLCEKGWYWFGKCSSHYHNGKVLNLHKSVNRVLFSNLFSFLIWISYSPNRWSGFFGRREYIFTGQKVLRFCVFCSPTYSKYIKFFTDEIETGYLFKNQQLYRTRLKWRNICYKKYIFISTPNHIFYNISIYRFNKLIFF